MNLIEQKEILRKSVYDSIFNGGFSNRPNGDYGKIPDFKGSDIAAQTLAKSKEWKKSKTIFVSPDSAQTPVRYLALKDNKNLIMASPNLEHGYYFLDGSCLDGVEMEASTKEGALKYKVDDDSKHRNMSVDLLVEGSVAVDREGHRIGKGSRKVILPPARRSRVLLLLLAIDKVGDGHILMQDDSACRLDRLLQLLGEGLLSRQRNGA